VATAETAALAALATRFASSPSALTAQEQWLLEAALQAVREEVLSAGEATLPARVAAVPSLPSITSLRAGAPISLSPQS